MSRRGFIDSKALLHDLLDRLESKPDVSRYFGLIDYDGLPSITEQDRIIRELRAVEQAGGVVLERARIDGMEIVKRVRLINPALLYQYLDRPPAAITVETALAHVRSRTDLPPSSKPVLDELAAAWTRGVSRFSLGVGEGDRLLEAITLTQAVQQRAHDPAAALIDYRTFSRAANVQSKALEQQSGAVVALFNRFYPELSRPDLEPAEMLATFGITRLPQPLLLSGPLAMDGLPLPKSSYYGFPSEEGERISLYDKVTYMLIIENYASFIRHVREVNANQDALIAYSGGFPARPILKQILRLAEVAQAPTFHWGDMDAGGVLIFRHLEDELKMRKIPLRPHLMQSELLIQHGSEKKALRKLRLGAFASSAIAELWKTIVSTSLTHEQESFRPISPLANQ